MPRVDHGRAILAIFNELMIQFEENIEMLEKQHDEYKIMLDESECDYHRALTDGADDAIVAEYHRFTLNSDYMYVLEDHFRKWDEIQREYEPLKHALVAELRRPWPKGPAQCWVGPLLHPFSRLIEKYGVPKVMRIPKGGGKYCPQYTDYELHTAPGEVYDWITEYTEHVNAALEKCPDRKRFYECHDYVLGKYPALVEFPVRERSLKVVQKYQSTRDTFVKINEKLESVRRRKVMFETTFCETTFM